MACTVSVTLPQIELECDECWDCVILTSLSSDLCMIPENITNFQCHSHTNIVMNTLKINVSLSLFLKKSYKSFIVNILYKILYFIQIQHTLFFKCNMTVAKCFLYAYHCE